jgi:8-oxo-dGTP pyrophosphatase MutT (NUDIX family)
MEKQPNGSAVPRLAATLLLLRDDPFEVLMVRRHAQAVFASALVFPGGAIEPGDYDNGWTQLIDDPDGLNRDERALRIAAIRETWEETGVLAAHGSEGPETVPLPSVQGTPFREVIEATGIRLALNLIQPFAHWVTPEQEPRRFDTHFFIARMPSEQVAVSDGGETVDIDWMNPTAAVARTAAGDRSIIFPTLMNLSRLAESDDTSTALAAAASRPHFTVRPQIVTKDDGSRMIVIPDEAGYALTEYPVTW